MTELRVGLAGIAAFALLAAATPAAAETLHIAAYVPAASDAATDIESIAVERFSGADGPRLSLLVEDRLREIQLRDRPWFTVLVPSLARDADAVLTGHAEARFSESKFKQKREICSREDEDGDCIERREVELNCLRVTVSLRPEMRLVTYDGRLQWSSPHERSEQVSFCPRVDEEPDADPRIDAMLQDIARQVRSDFAPSHFSSDVRIMESRNGLDRDTRNAFRDATQLTKSDEAAACREFERLHEANPEQDSLTFNVGLCAEQRGDFDAARRYYSAALASDRSDDEAQMGLERVASSLEGMRQVEARFGL